MKKIIFFTIIIATTLNVFSQHIENKPLTKSDYLQKSKSKKTIAWILAGTGITSVIISIATIDGTEIFSSIAGNDKPIKRFGALFFCGSAVALSSIPFFIISGKNKRKAMSLAFKIEQMPELQNVAIVNKPIPSATLKRRL